MERPGYQLLRVAVSGSAGTGTVAAVCFPELTGRVEPGHRVILNTTAVDLQLGSGGVHFVMARRHGREEPHEREGRNAGHIMKLRYTPMQVAVQAAGEPGSPWRATMEGARDIRHHPVVIGSVHSHLAPAVAGIRARRPDARIGYVMTDGAALPAAWSDAVQRLRDKGSLCGCVTSGHAFGGDVEAVNIYSALLASRHVLDADVTVVAMGPGVVGTGTTFESTALEVAPIADAVAALGGDAVVIPRMSEADPRERHRGISHHTLTALGRLTYARATVVLPPMPDRIAPRVHSQLATSRIDERHHIYLSREPCRQPLIPEDEGDLWRTMGRAYGDDPLFFHAAWAAGWYAGARVRRETRES